MSARKLLIVTGDYGVVQQIKQGLGGGGFAVHTAYSHLDAIYQLQAETFELIVVDASMVSRKTGEQTAVTLSHWEQRPPLLIYTASNGVSRFPNELVLTSLDQDTLRRSVARALRIPALDESPGAAVTPSRGVNTSVFWRDEEIQTLFALGRSLTEVLELSEVLNRVVEAARGLTNAEEGMILLPDGQSGQLYLRAKVGIDSELAENFRVKTNDTIAGTVYQSGQPMLVNEAGPQKVKTEYFVNALLYVPIIHKGQTLGVLGVNNKDKHDAFTERHRDLLVNLASYAAVAIENARIHGLSIRRGQELKALVDASQAINASLSFDHTLAAICEQFVRVLDVGHAEMYAWDRDKRVLRLLARFQQARWRTSSQPLIPLADRPVVRLALENRRHVLIRRDRHAVPAERETLERLGADALLVVPVTGGERVLGALLAYYVQMPDGNPAAEAVHRAQRVALEGLASSAETDSYSYSFRPLADASTALGADWLEFALYASESTALKLQFAVGGAVWTREPDPVIDLANFPDLQEALDGQKPLNAFQGDDTLSPGLRALFKVTRARALLALPLIERGQTQGLVLFADTLHARAFGTREVDLARAIVGQAATALENVSLVNDLEASLRELQVTQNRLIQTARLSAMGELAAAVAHQINNPLTTIVLDTELLLENASPDSRDHEVLSAISRAGKRAASVVRRLLAMARPNAPTTPRVPIEIRSSIEETIALVRPHIVREGIQLIAYLPEEALPQVLAAPGELDDVWLNLILNAHDVLVGRDSPEIGVEAEYDSVDGVVEVAVWDNGPGIPDEIVNDIFKPFFTTKAPGEGTGLGLHICRQVVDRVGGAISVQTAPSGTRFVVRLPVIRSS